MAQLKQVLRGIKSVQAKEGQNSTRIRLPITSNMLHRMRKVWDRESHKFDHIMLWAARTLCYFGFFPSRRDYISIRCMLDPHTHLSFSDLAADSASPSTMMRIRLKTSKTDPFRRGIDVFIGRTGNVLCPVTAMLAYLAVRGGQRGRCFGSRTVVF